jgi:hypothetical protein
MTIWTRTGGHHNYRVALAASVGVAATRGGRDDVEVPL